VLSVFLSPLVSAQRYLHDHCCQPAQQLLHPFFLILIISALHFAIVSSIPPSLLPASRIPDEYRPSSHPSPIQFILLLEHFIRYFDLSQLAPIGVIAIEEDIAARVVYFDTHTDHFSIFKCATALFLAF
jgi:hypothetical protein